MNNDDYERDYRTHLYRLLTQEKQDYERRVQPIINELVRLEQMRVHPTISVDLATFLAIKKAPAGEDRGQGGQETTTKNEPSV